MTASGAHPDLLPENARPGGTVLPCPVRRRTRAQGAGAAIAGYPPDFPFPYRICFRSRSQKNVELAPTRNMTMMLFSRLTA